MTTMTDSKAADVLAAHNEWRRGGDGETTDPKTLGLALERAIARLREPAGVGGDREADRRRFSDAAFNDWLDTGISDAGHTVWDAVGDVQAAWSGWEARQFAGDAVLLAECCGREECGGECGNEWRGMAMYRKPTNDDSAPQPPAEAQAQGGGEVWQHPDALPPVEPGQYGWFWVAVRRANGRIYSFPATYLNAMVLTDENCDQEESRGNRYHHGPVDEDEGTFLATGWHDAKEHYEYSAVYSPLLDTDKDELIAWRSVTDYGDTAPPSAPVGVERKYPDDGNGDDDAYNRGWNDCLDAIAQHPASDGGFTAADMMVARQEGRKEAQQPAAVAPVGVDTTRMALAAANLLAVMYPKGPRPPGPGRDAIDELHDALAQHPAAVEGAMATQGKKHDGPCWRNSHADCGC